jgi:hypothetical protein
MTKILCSSLTGEEIDEKTMLSHTDDTGIHYFKDLNELKEWYLTAKASRIDKGGYSNVDIDCYDKSVIPVGSTTKQTVILEGNTYLLRSEANAKKWIAGIPIKASAAQQIEP